MRYLNFADSAEVEKAYTGTVAWSFLFHDPGNNYMYALNEIMAKGDSKEQIKYFKVLLKNKSVARFLLMRSMMMMNITNLEMYDLLCKEMGVAKLSIGLNIASFFGKTDIVKYLLENYDVDASTGLSGAISGNQMNIFKIILGKNRSTVPIHEILSQNRIEMINYLFDIGILQTSLNLVRFSTASASAEMTLFLLSKVDLNNFEVYALETLNLAIIFHKTDLVAAILDRVTLVESENIRLLNLSAERSQWDCVKLLMKASNGNLLVYQRGAMLGASNLTLLEFIHQNLPHGIAMLSNLMTVIHESLRSFYPASVKFIVEAVPNLNLVSIAVMAAEYDCVPVLQFLVEEKNVNPADIFNLMTNQQGIWVGFESLVFLMSKYHLDEALVMKLFWSGIYTDNINMLNYLRLKYEISDDQYIDNFQEYIKLNSIAGSQNIFSMLPLEIERLKKVLENVHDLHRLSEDDLLQLFGANILSNDLREEVIFGLLDVSPDKIIRIFNLLTDSEKASIFNHAVLYFSADDDLLKTVINYAADHQILTEDNLYELLLHAVNSDEQNDVIDTILKHSIASSVLSERMISLIFLVRDTAYVFCNYKTILNFAIDNSFNSKAMIDYLLIRGDILRSDEMVTDILEFCVMKHINPSLSVLEKILSTERIVKNISKIQNILTLSDYDPGLLKIAAKEGIIFIFNEFIRSGKSIHYPEMQKIATQNGHFHILNLLTQYQASKKHKIDLLPSQISKKPRQSF